MRLNKEAVARVERGAALLDEKGPDGWRDRIDLDRLNMSDTSWCVLGQVYSGVTTWGGYGEGLRVLGVTPWPAGNARGPGYYGFDETTRADLHALDRAWTDYLTRTRH